MKIRVRRAGFAVALLLTSAVAGGAFAQTTTTYTYDVLGRLVKSSSNATTLQTTYGYDAADNRSQLTVAAPGSSSLTVTIGAGVNETGGTGGSFPSNTATVTNGGGSYTYAWTNTNDGNGTWATGTTSSFQPAVSGVNAVHGCASTATYTVTVTDTASHATAVSNGASYGWIDNTAGSCGH